MQKFPALTLILLSLMMLTNSIYRDHHHRVETYDQLTEAVKDLDSSSAREAELKLEVEVVHATLVFEETLIESTKQHLPHEKHHSSVNTSQLIRTNRIALPPPSIA